MSPIFGSALGCTEISLSLPVACPGWARQQRQKWSNMSNLGRSRRRRWRGVALGGHLQRGCRFCLAGHNGEATTGQIAEWCRPEIVYAGCKPTAIQIAKPFTAAAPHQFGQECSVTRGAYRVLLPTPVTQPRWRGFFGASLPPPALREGGHRSLACRLIAVRWRAVLMIPERQCPHPRRICWRCGSFHNAADHDAIAEHVVIVVVRFARGALTIRWRTTRATGPRVGQGGWVREFNREFSWARVPRSRSCGKRTSTRARLDTTYTIGTTHTWGIHTWGTHTWATHTLATTSYRSTSPC